MEQNYVNYLIFFITHIYPPSLPPIVRVWTKQNVDGTVNQPNC